MLLKNKSILKPGENIKIEAIKKVEATTNPFTITEDQQSCHNSKLGSFGTSFAEAIVRITAYDCFVEDDVDPRVREICRYYKSKIKRYHSKYRVSF